MPTKEAWTLGIVPEVCFSLAGTGGRNTNNLFEIIDLLRNERNITWQKLHEDIGISISTMFEWKKDDASVKSDNLVVLADYFDVSTDFLLRRTPNRFSHKENLRDSTLIIMQATESSNLDIRGTNIIVKLINAINDEL